MMLRPTADGVSLAVRAPPGAKQTAITGIYGEGSAAQLKIAVKAPALEGRAKTFGIAKSAVRLSAGELSRNKVFLLRGLGLSEANAVLAGQLASQPE
jgi:uncharacterized protein YggU (UPF0235/DUF167 family)